MKLSPIASALVTVALSVGPAAAQDAIPAETAQAATAAHTLPAPVPVATAPLPACELHVFPTLEGQALTTSLLSGFGVVGAIADAAAHKNRNVNDAAYLKEALGPQMQVDAIRALDVVQALKLPPSQVFFDTPIADRKITTKAATRLTSSTAPCYAELIVTQNLYQKKAIYGRSLNNRFVFKDFRGGRREATLVKGRGGNGLSQFPPKTEAEADAAEQDLRTAFAANFTEFAKTVTPKTN